MRTQWCREKIDKTAECCDLSRTAVSTVKRALAICEAHPELDGLSTDAVLAFKALIPEKYYLWASEQVMVLRKKGKVTKNDIGRICDRIYLKGGPGYTDDSKAPEERKATEPATAPAGGRDKGSLHSGQICPTEQEPKKERVKVKKERYIAPPTTFKGLTRHLRTHYADREAEIVGKILAYLKEMPA